MRQLQFFIPGQPQGKGRPRLTRTGRIYTPAKTRSYEDGIAEVAREAMGGSPLFDGAIALTVTATFQTPKSPRKDLREALKVGKDWHTSRPDGDNILKTMDALNGIVWRDDAQVARCAIAKRYGERPGLHIYVESL